MKRNVLVLAVVGALALLIGACGSGDSAHNAGGGRTIDIDMRDNDFSPASISVKAGEEVQFVFHNKGAVAHDAYVGDDAAQMSHEQDMRMSTGDMGHGAHGSDGITVQPGQTGALSHTFDRSGTTVIGCHQEGHYALGMRINVNVT